jgi:hypothetical protein
LFISLAALAGVLALATGCAAPAASSQETRVISVSGEGEATAAPDTAYVDLGIDATGDNLDQVLADANQTMTAVTEAVKALGIDEKDIQTTSFNVWTEEIYNRETGEPTGQIVYHVQNMITIKVREITQAGEVIGAGLDAGATEVNSLRFGIEDTSALEAEARTAAAQEARDKAEQLAEALGVEVGELVNVSESIGYPSPIYVERVAFAADMAAGAAPPVSTGELTVTITVNVSYEIQQ